MALRHRNKKRRAAGEPIYCLGSMCEHPRCFNKGERFAVDNFITWLCKKHQSDLPSALFHTFKIPFEIPDEHGNVFTADSVMGFSQQAKVLASHKDNNGMTIITAHENVGKPVPVIAWPDIQSISLSQMVKEIKPWLNLK